MFWVVIIFLLLQFLFMFKAVQTVPFFLFNMYSTRLVNYDTSYFNTVYVNGKRFPIERFSGRERETLIGSLEYFRKLKGNGYRANDSATIARRFSHTLPSSLYHLVYNRLTNQPLNDGMYFSWWRRYLEQLTNQRVDSFSIVQSRIIWTPYFHHLNDTVSLIKYGGRN
ncbi:MAG: hypothetical protein ACJ75B_16400 [Flavisolibacter sp.]